MMKQLIAILMLIVGVSTLVLCLVLYSQFRKLATSPNPRIESEEYSLLRKIIPTPTPGANAKPQDVGRAISRRIYGVGAVGLFMIIGGFKVMLIRKQDGSVS